MIMIEWLMGRPNQMKPNSNIIHGGGWVERQTTGKPKASALTFISVVWLLVSICASTLFWNGFPGSFSWSDWLFISLIAVEPIWILLAVVFWLIEPSRTITERKPNPSYDMHNLY
jgi:hypothetical protein